jgi:hypothetical protein
MRLLGELLHTQEHRATGSCALRGSLRKAPSLLLKLIVPAQCLCIRAVSQQLQSDLQGTVQHAAHSAQALSCMYRLLYAAQAILYPLLCAVATDCCTRGSRPAHVPAGWLTMRTAGTRVTN